MPKRTDLESILIIGAGPIIIGQGCEFDYSGTQACRALRAEGYRVVLINSNPATIMTDPQVADATYIEAPHWKTVASVIEKERPDALLPTMGGQTALNCTMDLEREGVLQAHGVEVIGASRETIEKAENRDRFRSCMQHIGLKVPRSSAVRSWEEAEALVGRFGFPLIVRPSFTLGGAGGGVARDLDEFRRVCRHGLDTSPLGEVLLEESLLGWKEFELEVVRDRADNCIVVCTIENLDPMGLHTGDSITVAPAQTLTDKEHQRLRNAAIAILREVGVETGGSNVQFALHPEHGEMAVIEMNPRVSRSSALASKATGFPIAKVAARLAVGYTLDEMANEITGDLMPASFEPVLDYVVTKMPRFDFEKFPSVDDRLTVQMKSVGEAMGIGRTFQESLQKALCSLETGSHGLDLEWPGDMDAAARLEHCKSQLREPRARRLWYVAEALRLGLGTEEIHRQSGIDPWFLAQLHELVQCEEEVRRRGAACLQDAGLLRELKRRGFSDVRLGQLTGMEQTELRRLRHALEVRPVFKRVDSCAAEFPTPTAYLYSSYEEECEAAPGTRRKVVILGGGPNRIGQGIEFDYCCVHAALELRAQGFETIMINCNPETVSTDYDVSDRLYFEPLTLEHVLEILAVEKPWGVIVQYGGQTPLKLARALEREGVPILGTSPDSIDLAEDRQRFQGLLKELGLRQPPNCIARSVEEAVRHAGKLGMPLVVRPSYVLGGRAMEIVRDMESLRYYMGVALSHSPDTPVLLDRFLEDAVEVDVDAVADGEQVLLGGILEHIEQAGIHSGDSACSLPPRTLDAAMQQRLRAQLEQLARALKVKGLMNVQFAIHRGNIYVLEVNPRASRTVPFIAKATGLPLAAIGARCMAGIRLREQKDLQPSTWRGVAVKEAVFPFDKLPGVDLLLGPEMKSTGEVMGLGRDFGEAFLKAQRAAQHRVPDQGLAFISVRDADKPAACDIARGLAELGFTLCATRSTGAALRKLGLHCKHVNKVLEGTPHILGLLEEGAIQLIINTTEGRQSIADSYSIRRTALQRRVFYTTTMAGAEATLEALRRRDTARVIRLQDLHTPPPTSPNPPGERKA